ncbi:hypothetical protein PVAP13_3KG288800 [Panicum virgatum]|uniref:Uncharacterized protein n=1 Tax=Panicum virgatum TaxID=38727 RepID=A0A8T0UUJ7_PANVG|nr:hypothetical protein PVAP13_3KG288800 [Panicum virgatum]
MFGSPRRAAFQPSQKPRFLPRLSPQTAAQSDTHHPEFSAGTGRSRQHSPEQRRRAPRRRESAQAARDQSTRARLLSSSAAEKIPPLRNPSPPWPRRGGIKRRKEPVGDRETRANNRSLNSTLHCSPPLQFFRPPQPPRAAGTGSATNHGARSGTATASPGSGCRCTDSMAEAFNSGAKPRQSQALGEENLDRREGREWRGEEQGKAKPPPPPRPQKAAVVPGRRPRWRQRRRRMGSVRPIGSGKYLRVPACGVWPCRAPPTTGWRWAPVAAQCSPFDTAPSQGVECGRLAVAALPTTSVW